MDLTLMKQEIADYYEENHEDQSHTFVKKTVEKVK